MLEMLKNWVYIVFMNPVVRTSTVLTFVLTAFLSQGAVESDSSDQLVQILSPRQYKQEGDHNVTYESIAPIPGMPVLFDLSLCPKVLLDQLHVDVCLYQQMATLNYTFSIEVDRKIPGKFIPCAIPFEYGASVDSSSVRDTIEVRKIPFPLAFPKIQTSCDDLKIKYELKQGFHPNAMAPSLLSLKNINHWLIAYVPNKPGRHVVSMFIEIPYANLIKMTKDSLSCSAPHLEMSSDGLNLWGVSSQFKATSNIYCGEMGESWVTIKNDKGVSVGSKTAKSGIYFLDLTTNMGIPASKYWVFDVGPSWQKNKNSIIIQGKKYRVDKDYDIQASSSLLADYRNEAIHADNLKKAEGLWAEGKDGDGKGEALTLTFKKPQKLEGFFLGSGIFNEDSIHQVTKSPLEHPNILFSLHNRPKKIVVSINNEYFFSATLRDDWQVQYILIPSYHKPINTMKITIDEVYPGASSQQNTYFNLLYPVVK